MSSSLRPENAKEVEVTWEDQQNINKFGRLFTRLQDLNDELALKDTEVEALKDAGTEVDNVFDDDSCRVKIGEIFFRVSNDEALEFVQEITAKKNAQHAAMLKEKANIQKEIEQLKKTLYARFGNTISLDG